MPRAALALSLTVLVSTAAQAQSVDEIIARNIEAKGGAALLKSTTSVRTVGKGSMQGAEVSITSSTKRPYFVRNEMEMAGQKIVHGFDGETMWMAMGTMPAQALPPGPQMEVLKQSSQLDSPLLDYKAKGTTIELGEPGTDGGRKQYHLVVKPKAGPTLHYFIDTETNLESKMVITVEEGGQKMTMEMRFSDFKTVEGRTLPFTISQVVNGNPIGQMQFEKIEFNVPMDDALFRMPKQ
jgi:outer membrane lipoprotein-sorting protein